MSYFGSTDILNKVIVVGSVCIGNRLLIAHFSIILSSVDSSNNLLYFLVSGHLYYTVSCTSNKEISVYVTHAKDSGWVTIGWENY